MVYFILVLIWRLCLHHNSTHSLYKKAVLRRMQWFHNFFFLSNNNIQLAKSSSSCATDARRLRCVPEEEYLWSEWNHCVVQSELWTCGRRAPSGNGSEGESELKNDAVPSQTWSPPHKWMNEWINNEWLLWFVCKHMFQEKMALWELTKLRYSVLYLRLCCRLTSDVCVA